MKYYAAGEEDPKLEELEAEGKAEDEEEEEEAADEGRTVKITATITIDSGVNMSELKDIIFCDLDDIKVESFDWEDVKE